MTNLQSANINCSSNFEEYLKDLNRILSFHHAAKVDGLNVAYRIEALEAENERLRNAMVVMDNTVRELTAALTQIAKPCSVVVEPSGKAGGGWKKMYYAWRKIAVDRVDIARAALTKENTDAPSD